MGGGPMQGGGGGWGQGGSCPGQTMCGSGAGGMRGMSGQALRPRRSSSASRAAQTARPPQPQTPQQAQHSSPQQAQQQTSPLGLYGMSPSQSLSSQSLPSLGEQQPAGGRAQRTAGPMMGGIPVEGTPNWAANTCACPRPSFVLAS
ncbi:hypothetical protein EMIHUDRAFT_204027 [Emiliania huxleyi CCMP1516]|uniref:Uncharacterized protein n=2 Tax=Emiliania huxleyi TaxID=2903 RepID=A0A0D3K0U2_EMIH1|nr:hypothetical protein EMIHUDRAFT_204027 [Emiliania huxleyi CCMP1516]EOD29377.1 hypothetical protein EMIHUDRAFT_204027 [Emiliania huxleyi CCMP1516]|eukprot:XP_005781806.1 hypothetical protein EMIHUDRAFT_204027 [Emiliania huxleyi CCMP1516]